MKFVLKYAGKSFIKTTSFGVQAFYTYTQETHKPPYECLIHLEKPLLDYPVENARFKVDEFLVDVRLLPNISENGSPSVFENEKVFVLKKKKQAKGYLIFNPFNDRYMEVKDLAYMKIWDVHYNESMFDSNTFEFMFLEPYYLSEKEIAQLTIYNSYEGFQD